MGIYGDRTFDEILREGAGEFYVQIEEKELRDFSRYMELLKEWNQKFNLTAIEEDHEIGLKHFVDSLSIMPLLPAGRPSLVDVGTGAGFPGIPIKIVRQDTEVTLVDSLDKRVGFLREVIGDLGLEGIDAIHSRAEDFGAKPEYREKFDVSIARAVAALPVLLEYCLPLTRVGGVFIAMKGSAVGEELEQTGKALDILGGKVESVKEMLLPFSDIKRTVVIVRKFRQTPAKYPRKPGKPSKEPLI